MAPFALGAGLFAGGVDILSGVQESRRVRGLEDRMQRLLALREQQLAEQRSQTEALRGVLTRPRAPVSVPSRADMAARRLFPHE